jgi:hypothetical protein
MKIFVILTTGRLVGKKIKRIIAVKTVRTIMAAIRLNRARCFTKRCRLNHAMITAVIIVPPRTPKERDNKKGNITISKIIRLFFNFLLKPISNKK